MTARLIDGRARAARLRAELAREVAQMRADKGVMPGLAVVLIGADPASGIYVRSKVRACEETGMRSDLHALSDSTSEAELLALIARLNGDPTVHGILVQLPLPPQIDRARVLAAISPDKDVDGFHPINAGRLATGQQALVPCTPRGCMMLLEEEIGDLRGLTACVIGCSPIVGRPMVQLLLHRDCSVLVAHKFTADPGALARQADILVVAAGVPGLVTSDWIRPGAVVIDVGINRITRPDGSSNIIGDVAEGAADLAAAITPVPGGVGPMTIACLLSNTLDAARAANPEAANSNAA
ncbi:bifunctional 5,10-methylenetetrahydrofolate dehydrogenase/5,10-methenyltetrahydrofolate cyclohydrolase [Primorskyibacter sp. 2E233]|uniref:bifunctional 5,10-methylenetetrahydrofolate dehydrogenase/5,10-methenyltetrahydrofolate cyclohydrolase n=1 Tax=Primorskyibacter sp. 2E233 TaxID=3413431 RepID=UPI003BF30A94